MPTTMQNQIREKLANLEYSKPLCDFGTRLSSVRLKTNNVIDVDSIISVVNQIHNMNWNINDTDIDGMIDFFQKEPKDDAFKLHILEQCHKNDYTLKIQEIVGLSSDTMIAAKEYPNSFFSSKKTYDGRTLSAYNSLSQEQQNRLKNNPIFNFPTEWSNICAFSDDTFNFIITNSDMFKSTHGYNIPTYSLDAYDRATPEMKSRIENNIELFKERQGYWSILTHMSNDTFTLIQTNSAFLDLEFLDLHNDSSMHRDSSHNASSCAAYYSKIVERIETKLSPYLTKQKSLSSFFSNDSIISNSPLLQSRLCLLNNGTFTKIKDKPELLHDSEFLKILHDVEQSVGTTDDDIQFAIDNPRTIMSNPITFFVYNGTDIITENDIVKWHKRYSNEFLSEIADTLGLTEEQEQQQCLLLVSNKNGNIKLAYIPPIDTQFSRNDFIDALNPAIENFSKHLMFNNGYKINSHRQYENFTNILSERRCAFPDLKLKPESMSPMAAIKHLLQPVQKQYASTKLNNGLLSNASSFLKEKSGPEM